jgi:glycosyltransferase involved in cell wall biosynthesis
MAQIELPMVTFALVAFNQEAYVDDAISAALAQTYSPLEIILSDDCSSDATFERMQDAAIRYDGPHNVRLNRNARNLGIADHVNLIGRLACGDFIVAAAGDDISKPERTAVLVEHWLRRDKCAGSFHSAYEDLSLEGRILGTKLVDFDSRAPPRAYIQKNLVVGATEAWSKEIFGLFGPIHSSIVHEDRVLAFRASILGGVHYVAEPLVAYRRGGISTPNMRSKLVARRTNAHRYICDMAQMIGDVETARRAGVLDEDRSLELISAAGDRLTKELLLVRTTSFSKSVSAVCQEFLALLQRVAFVAFKLLFR